MGWKEVSIPFRADTGFELNRISIDDKIYIFVSIPFRADTGFERRPSHGTAGRIHGFNPFQG